MSRQKTTRVGMSDDLRSHMMRRIRSSLPHPQVSACFHDDELAIAIGGLSDADEQAIAKAYYMRCAARDSQTRVFVSAPGWRCA